MICTIISAGKELHLKNKNEYKKPYPMMKVKLQEPIKYQPIRFLSGRRSGRGVQDFFRRMYFLSDKSDLHRQAESYPFC